MATVLFIKANDRPADQAVSVRLYEAFLKTYRENHPEDSITELDLYREELPYYGQAAITGLYKAGQGLETTAEERKAAEIATRYLDQFLVADKVVFAFPLWNFTVPAPLHTYVSYLSQAGKTFRYTAEGPVGLVGDKKVALLTARGGVYSAGERAPYEMGLNYMRNVLRFWGVQNPEVIVVEGHNQFPDRSADIVSAGLSQAANVAAGF